MRFYPSMIQCCGISLDYLLPILLSFFKKIPIILILHLLSRSKSLSFIKGFRCLSVRHVSRRG